MRGRRLLGWDPSIGQRRHVSGPASSSLLTFRRADGTPGAPVVRGRARGPTPRPRSSPRRAGAGRLRARPHPHHEGWPARAGAWQAAGGGCRRTRARRRLLAAAHRAHRSGGAVAGPSASSMTTSPRTSIGPPGHRTMSASGGRRRRSRGCLLEPAEQGAGRAGLEVEAGEGAEQHVVGERRLLVDQPRRSSRTASWSCTASASDVLGVVVDQLAAASRAARGPAPSAATAASWSPRTPRGGRAPPRAAGGAGRTATWRCSAPGPRSGPRRRRRRTSGRGRSPPGPARRGGGAGGRGGRRRTRRTGSPSARPWAGLEPGHHPGSWGRPP